MNNIVDWILAQMRLVDTEEEQEEPEHTHLKLDDAQKELERLEKVKSELEKCAQ